MVETILDNPPAHSKRVIDEEATGTEFNERVHHMKIVARLKPDVNKAVAWPMRSKILDLHRDNMLGWPEELIVKMKQHPKKRLYTAELGKLLRWLRTDCRTVIALRHSGHHQDGR